MPLPQKSKTLYDFAIRCFEHMNIEGASGEGIDFPEFDLMPFDYLEYAEAEIEGKSDASRINCVSHLKRAVECEMDTFLYAFGLNKAIKPNNFPTKMEWIGKMGIMNSRSLKKLNLIRNKVEHEYSVPEIADLETYFELANAFVHVLEGYLLLMTYNREVSWKTAPGSAVNTSLEIHYLSAKALIVFKWAENENLQTLEFAPDSKDDFLFAIQAYLLFCREASGLINSAFVIDRLKAIATS